jgi:hypothetical protein
MPVRNIKNYKENPQDISGLNISGSSRNKIAFGVIPADSYTIGDVLCFNLDSYRIIEGRINTHEGEPSTLEILPGTNLTHPLQLKLAKPVDISYVVHYVKGGSGNALINDAVHTAPSEGERLNLHII